VRSILPQAGFHRPAVPTPIIIIFITGLQTAGLIIIQGRQHGNALCTRCPRIHDFSKNLRLPALIDLELSGCGAVQVRRDGQVGAVCLLIAGQRRTNELRHKSVRIRGVQNEFKSCSRGDFGWVV
jgi:hypothetical protein